MNLDEPEYLIRRELTDWETLELDYDYIMCGTNHACCQNYDLIRNHFIKRL